MNDNCLDGVKCPACGNESTFRIRALAWMEVTDDGTDPMLPKQDIEWDEATLLSCNDCHLTDSLGAFKNHHFSPIAKAASAALVLSSFSFRTYP